MMNNSVFKRTSLLILFIVFGLFSINYFIFATVTQLQIKIVPPPQCSDGIDNDGDGKIDYPDDPDCSSPDDNDERKLLGGGGIILPPSVVNFSGKAYPKSTITLLKDAQVAATTIAGIDANFYISLTDLSGGTYIFSVYSEDKEGKKSSLFIIPLNIPPGATTSVSGIFIAPTIDINKSEIKKGEEMLIFGQSFPNAEIRISIKSKEKEFFVNTLADKDGRYSYNLDTALLDFGVYQIIATAFFNNLSSNPSRIIDFVVATETIFRKLCPEVPLKGDFNNDCRVNLIDFSILIYWFDRPDPPARIDLSEDGRVDLVDFSIMAYYWTG